MAADLPYFDLRYFIELMMESIPHNPRGLKKSRPSQPSEDHQRSYLMYIVAIFSVEIYHLFPSEINIEMPDAFHLHLILVNCIWKKLSSDYRKIKHYFIITTTVAINYCSNCNDIPLEFSWKKYSRFTR